MNRTTIKALIEASKKRDKAHASTIAEVEKRAEADPEESAPAWLALAKEDLEAGKELRAALEKELEDAETLAGDPKWRKTIEQIEVRHYLEPASEGKKLAGVAKEVNEELRLDDHVMPYDALLDDKDRVELRQDVATTVPDAARSKLRQPVIPRVFRRTDAAFCGIAMPTAPRGQPIYVVLSGGVAGAMANEGIGVDSEAATFDSTIITPKRQSAAYTLRIEQTAQFADLESVLRADLRMAMGKLMDDTVVSEDETGANTGSILSHATGAPAADPTAKAKLSDFDQVFADGIDGLYAYGRDGVSLLHGVETERFLSVERHDETAMTYGAMVNAAGGMRRATTRVAAPVGNVQKAYRFVPNELRAFAPVWEGIEFIRDPYTDAKKGETRITAIMLFGFDIVRGSVTERRFKLA